MATDQERMVRKLGSLGDQVREFHTNANNLLREVSRAENLAVRMDSRGLQREIATWARETFDEPNQDHRLTKLGNEFEELRRLTTTDRANQAGIADECADIMHLMFQIAEAWGFDLLDETRKKFEVNKSRQWEKQPDGTYQHT